MDIVVASAVGLILGSFLSVLLARWPKFDDVVAGRSRCPHCSHVLAWRDLVPLVSWLLLRGRCRYCRAPVSPLYPALELVMAGALGGYVAAQGLVWPWDLFILPAIVILVMLFFFDLEWQVLPDALTGLLTVLALGHLFIDRPFPWTTGLATGLFAAAAVLLVYVFTKGRGVGLGDVKLAFPLGVLFGSPGTLGIVLTAVWAGALVGVGLLVTRRATMKTALPFGSFWTAASVAALIWPVVADWPFRLILPQ